MRLTKRGKVAWNYAGLEWVVYSNAYIVDLTPPDVEGAVLDGLGGQDVDYQSATVVSANWEGIVDRESGISECRWGLGKQCMSLFPVARWLLSSLY